VERAANRREILSRVFQRFGRPGARRETHPAGRAVGHDVHRAQTVAAIERRRDLASRRARAVQHDSLDAWTQIAEDRLQSADGGIDEKDFGATARSLIVRAR
jgi:hypothetical protein